MKVYRKISKIAPKKESIISIGNFDGIHLGHQEILKTVKDMSLKYDLPSAIISFYPSASSFLYPVKFQGHIDTDLEKIEKMSSYKIDEFLMLEFDEKIRKMRAGKFLSEVIVANFKPKIIVVGYDHHFGYDRQGSYDFLKQNKEKYDYKLVKINERFLGKNKLSSSNIRTLIIDKDVEKASTMLGSYFKIRGKVIKGKGIGKTIEFPTANIEIDKLKTLPGNGVYFVKVVVGSKESYLAMCNIGVKPTISNKNIISCEVHIFDFNQSLYGKNVDISFIKFIRLERKFDTIDSLKKQLIVDKNKCLEYSCNNV